MYAKSMIRGCYNWDPFLRCDCFTGTISVDPVIEEGIPWLWEYYQSRTQGKEDIDEVTEICRYWDTIKDNIGTRYDEYVLVESGAIPIRDLTDNDNIWKATFEAALQLAAIIDKVYHTVNMVGLSRILLDVTGVAVMSKVGNDCFSMDDIDKFLTEVRLGWEEDPNPKKKKKCEKIREKQRDVGLLDLGVRFDDFRNTTTSISMFLCSVIGILNAH